MRAFRSERNEWRKSTPPKGWRGWALALISLLGVMALLAGMVLVDLPLPEVFAADAVLICEEEEHVHDSSCYVDQLSCQVEEHIHTEACFDENGALICTLPEHTHDGNCYTQVLVCDKEEHQHTSECYAKPSSRMAEPQEPEQPSEPEQPQGEEQAQDPEQPVNPEQEPEGQNPEQGENPGQSEDTGEPEASENEPEAPEDNPEESENEPEAPGDEPEESEDEPQEPEEELPAQAPLTLGSLVPQRNPVAVNEEVVWTFEASGAELIEYQITNALGEVMASGALTDGRSISWKTGAGGIYGITLTAQNETEQATASSSVTVTAGPLQAALNTGMKYTFAGEQSLSFSTSITGGYQPYTVDYWMEANGQIVFEKTGYEPTISHMPGGFGVHTLHMRVVDAMGETVSVQYALPVAVRENETRSQWEEAFRDVVLTGDYAQDIVTIASTQLGYQENTRNFIIDEEGKVRGYTRYGHWYGAPYGDWCAMFVSFAAHYAEIPEEFLPREANTNRWKAALGSLYVDAWDGYVPQMGDLVFFNHDGEIEPQHVGIVTGLENGSIVHTIEGNSGNAVSQREYPLTGGTIVAYVPMSVVKARAQGIVPPAQEPDAGEENPETGNEENGEEPQGELVCGLEEHTHTEECYDEEFNLICGLEEHTHTQECYQEPEAEDSEETDPSERLSLCGLEEHTHTEECYDEEGNLICGLEEHTHTEECYQDSEETDPSERIPLCGLEEHIHTEECYDEEGNLICGLEEHTHTEECYQETEETDPSERIPLCGLEEHIHTEECYDEEGNLICGLEEHTHTEECYANKEADLETPADWEATLPGLPGEDWAENLVLVARSQLGYEESTENFTLSQDGALKQGYTRYGAWYGDPYGNWDAMFVAFSLHYAQIPPQAVPAAGDAHGFASQLEDLALYRAASDYAPQAGDLVFFDQDGDGNADHMGILQEVGEESLSAIQGDSEGRVAANEYVLQDSAIVGYGSLEAAWQRYQLLRDPIPLLPGYDFALRFKGEGYTVIVGYNSDAEIPDDASLMVEEYLPGTPEYETRYQDLQRVLAQRNGQEPLASPVEGDVQETAETPQEIVEEAQEITESQVAAAPGLLQDVWALDSPEALQNTGEAETPQDGEAPEAGQTPEEGEAFEDEEAPEASQDQEEPAPEEDGAHPLNFARVFNVEIMAQGVEIEPQAPVMVQISFDDEPQAGGSSVLHFAEEGTELLEGEAVNSVVEESGASQVEFSLSSFSDIAIFAEGIGIMPMAIITGGYTVDVTKTWEGTPEASATFNLLNNGTATGQTITVNAGSNWKGSITGLDATGAYSLTEQNTTDAWRAAMGSTPSSDEVWVNVPTSITSPVSGAKYRFVSGSYAVIANNNNNNASNSYGVAAQNATSTAQQWQYNGTYFFNVQHTSTRLYSRSWNTSGIQLGTSNSGSTYLRLQGSTLSTGQSSSNATRFTPQTLSTAGLSFTAKNIKEKSPPTSVYFDPQKQLDSLDDGVTNPDTTLTGQDFSRLYLDARALGTPIDLVVVVDRSTSMSYRVSANSTSGSGDYRDQAVMKLLNGTDSTGGFVKRFLAMHAENYLSIVWFAGDAPATGAIENSPYLSGANSGIVKGWTRDQGYTVDDYAAGRGGATSDQNRIGYRSASGTNVSGSSTNYFAGMWEAADMLRSPTVANNGHVKMVVFLTDGVPTVYVGRTDSAVYPRATYTDYRAWVGAGSPGPGALNSLYRKGTGVETAPNPANNQGPALEAFEDFKANNPGVIFSTIMFAPSTASTTVTSQMTFNGGTMTHTAGAANLDEVFANTVGPIISAKTVQIEDQLSKYVALHTALPDLKVTRENLLTGGAKVTLWQTTGSVSAAGGVIGAPTANNGTGSNQIIDTVTYTPATPGDSTGKIVVKFKENYAVDQQWKYVLSFNVKTTVTAYEEFAESGYRSTGDPNTDYAANTTSSGKPGFHSNKTADLTYKIGNSPPITAPYPHPVVQVKILNTSVSVEKLWQNMDGSPYTGTKPSVTINLLREKLTTHTVPGGGTGPSHTVTFRIVGTGGDGTIYAPPDSTRQVAHGGSITFYSYLYSHPDSVTFSGSSGARTVIDDGVWNESKWLFFKKYTFPNITSDGVITITYPNFWHNQPPDVFFGVTAFTAPSGSGGTTTYTSWDDDTTFQQPITLPVASSWSHQWNDLPLYSPSLEPYRYYVEENPVPAGFTVSYSSNNDDRVTSGKITVTNKAVSVPITLKKVDITTRTPLTGAEFNLYRELADGETPPPGETAVPIPGTSPVKYGVKVNATPYATDSGGVVSISGLSAAAYWLEESKAPDGYQLPAVWFRFDLAADGTITPSASGWLEVDGTNLHLLLVMNQKGYELPETGGPGRYMGTRLGMALMALACLVYIAGRGKRRGKEGNALPD